MQATCYQRSFLKYFEAAWNSYDQFTSVSSVNIHSLVFWKTAFLQILRKFLGKIIDTLQSTGIDCCLLVAIASTEFEIMKIKKSWMCITLFALNLLAMRCST